MVKSKGILKQIDNSLMT